MKKLVICTLLLFNAAQPVFSQAPKSSLLWEISGKGLKTPSYLFGTFHILCKSDFETSAILESKIKNSKQFFCEIKLDDPSIQMQMATKMIMKDTTIEDIAGAEDYKKMSASFQQITGMPFGMFNRFKPFMSLSMLTINMISCTETVQPETEFMKIAQEKGIPVLGLETLDEELAAINKSPLDSQVSDLRKMLLNFDSSKIELRQMLNVYKKRNVDSVYRFIAKGSGGSSFEKDLVITRNKNWMPVVLKAIKEKPSFFAVGAGHVGGPQGLIRLLRAQGYTVTPITY